MPCTATWKASLNEAAGADTNEIAEDLFGLVTQRMVSAWKLDMEVSLYPGLYLCNPYKCRSAVIRKVRSQLKPINLFVLTRPNCVHQTNQIPWSFNIWVLN